MAVKEITIKVDIEELRKQYLYLISLPRTQSENEGLLNLIESILELEDKDETPE